VERVLAYTTSDSREKRELYERKVSTGSRYLQRMPLTHLLLIGYERRVLPSSQPPNRKKKLSTQCIPEYLQYCCCHTTRRSPNVAISVGFRFSKGSPSFSSPYSGVKERVRRGSTDRGLRVSDCAWLLESKDGKNMGFGALLSKFRLFGRLNMARD
jgi:hypothetical protein